MQLWIFSQKLMPPANLALREAMRASLPSVLCWLFSFSPVLAQVDVDGSFDRLSIADRANVDAYILAPVPDPLSTQFKLLFLQRQALKGTATALCGAVNTKNRMGGYIGFEPFAIVYRGGDVRPWVLNPVEDPVETRGPKRKAIVEICAGR